MKRDIGKEILEDIQSIKAGEARIRRVEIPEDVREPCKNGSKVAENK